MNSKMNVPELRFSEFGGEWKETKIGDVSRIYGRIGYRGYTVEDIVGEGEGAVTLSPSNFIENKIDINKSTYISWFKYEESPEIKIYNGDILFVKTGSTYGKTAFVSNLNHKATINPQIVVLKEITINNKFLGYVIVNTSIKRQVERIVVGGAIPTMSQKELSKMSFKLPSKQEQEKIASFLSSVDTKIEQLTSKVKLLQEYKKGVMQKIFSLKIRFKDDDGSDYPEWVEKKLENYGKLINGLTYSPDNITDNGLLVLRSSNIQNNKITLDDNIYVNIDVSDESLTKENDILICVRNGSKRLIGKSTIIPKNLIKSTHGAFMTVFRGESNDFISHWFQTPIFYKEVHKNLGATINSINGSNLKKFKTIFPSRPEQIKIANFLSSIDSKIEQTEKQLDSTKEFKKALLQQMFV